MFSYNKLFCLEMDFDLCFHTINYSVWKWTLPCETYFTFLVISTKGFCNHKAHIPK